MDGCLYFILKYLLTGCVIYYIYCENTTYCIPKLTIHVVPLFKNKLRSYGDKIKVKTLNFKDLYDFCKNKNYTGYNDIESIAKEINDRKIITYLKLKNKDVYHATDILRLNDDKFVGTNFTSKEGIQLIDNKTK